MNAHDFTFPAIDGGSIALFDLAGKVVLLVNTASECGFTPQYAGLQALWERYRDRGLVVLGVPSNDFGAQEPGGDAEIQAFCAGRYRIDFPLAARQKVVGAAAHPFYRGVEEAFGDAATPRWNFHKYLVDPHGEVVEVWPAQVEPLSDEVVRAVEARLPAPD